MRADRVTLVGTALHRGDRAAVTLARAPGPIRWRVRGLESTLGAMTALRTDRGLAIGPPDGRFTIDSAEHLLAAVGGLSIATDLAIETDDAELPMLDGGASRWVEALFDIGFGATDSTTQARPLRVVREAMLRHGDAVYRFAPAESVRVSVDVTFPPPIGRECATWDGDPADFAARIAPARTFGWIDEHEALLARGRARGADLESVLVLTKEGVHPGCRPKEPDEIARHKLLDLVGDMTLHGGPPVGQVDAIAPGHGATFAIFRDALRSGVVQVSA